MNEIAQTSGEAMQSREWRLERMMSGDKTYDGEFLVGVRTTGIYCLPSCRARKPLPQNVVFFEQEADAVAFGLRACKKCRPDNFYRNHDPDKEAITTLASRIIAEPAKWGDAAQMADAAGVGTTKLFALFRQHFHTTPLVFLRGARIRAACDLLMASGEARITGTAFAVGYESLSAFHAQFRTETGLAPGQFRDWVNGTGSADTFTLTVSPFCWNYARRIQCRDGKSLSEKASPNGFSKAFGHDNQTVVLHLEWHENGVQCRINAQKETPTVRRAAHHTAVRLLGIGGSNGEQTAWENKADADPIFARLIGNRHGLRVPLTADVWESVAWAIIGQQINLPFAYTLRRAVGEIVNAPTVCGLSPFPSTQAVAQLDTADLTARQFSQRKAEYLIDTARMVVSGTLDLGTLQSGTVTPFGDAEKTLLAIRGLGPWSAHYILMRGCNWPDCVPIGDTGITAGLRKLFDLDHPPDKTEAAQLMERFAPFRSLATHHLWASLGAEE